jgi:hypothetical protein
LLLLLLIPIFLMLLIICRILLLLLLFQFPLLLLLFRELLLLLLFQFSLLLRTCSSSTSLSCPELAPPLPIPCPAVPQLLLLLRLLD